MSDIVVRILDLLLVFKQKYQKPFMKAVHKPVFDEDFTFNDEATGIALSGRNWQYFEHSIEPFVNDHSLLQYPDQNEMLERIDCLMPKAKNHLTNTSELTSTRIPSNGRHLLTYHYKHLHFDPHLTKLAYENKASLVVCARTNGSI